MVSLGLPTATEVAFQSAKKESLGSAPSLEEAIQRPKRLQLDEDKYK